MAKQRASRAKSVVSGVGTASGTSTAAAVGGSIFAATGTAGTAAAMKELQWRVKMEPVWKAPKRRKGIDAAVRKILRKHPQATNNEVEMLIPEHEGMTVVAKGGRRYEVYRDFLDKKPAIFEIEVSTDQKHHILSSSLPRYTARWRKKS